MSLKDCVIVDLDGTVANCDWRLPLIKNKPKNWKAFFEGIPHDQPIYSMCRMVETMWKNDTIRVVFSTGRPDTYRKESIEWIYTHIYAAPHALYMRSQKDGHRPAHEVKKDLLSQIRADGFNPVMAIDDDEKVCKMYREEGLIVLYCGKENEDG